MTTELGVVEGFFGRPWTWEERTAVVERLAPHGYRFYHYAPKGDAFLRRNWRAAHPDSFIQEFGAFAQVCKANEVRLGIGLTPFEAFNNFDSQTRADFTRRVKDLSDLGIDELGIFFDDMKADLPDLAARQIDIIHLAAEIAPHLRLVMCPSYYSDDPVLDRVFGSRPEGYLEALGSGLAQSIEIYWTGEEVCSREISPGHLRTIGSILQRKPLLWDNYPVNDGPRMSKFLHLRGFTGRPAKNAPFISRHAINPASQATLSCIPAITLARSYALGDEYCYGAAMWDAAQHVCGPQLARLLQDDLLSFQDMGLDRIQARCEALIARYAAIDHPAADEVVQWLEGKFAITGEQVHTQ
jgi:hyaluronoglucosaminidase